MRFVCVDDGVPEATPRLLREACAARDIVFETADPRNFDFTAASRLGAGDLLYRPAVSLAAHRVEQHLHSPPVAGFYPSPDDIFFAAANQTLLFERAELPVPANVYCLTTERDQIRALADTLGLPLVVKVPGMSGGIGVMRADTLAGLFSLLDYLSSISVQPMLMEFIPRATHWRAIVVGETAVAAYRNLSADDDFRTIATSSPDDCFAEVRADIAELAVAAVAATRREHGGVDILERADGRLYLLEANFPCYYAHAQLIAGIDIAGAMVDHLAARAQAHIE